MFRNQWDNEGDDSTGEEFGYSLCPESGGAGWVSGR